MAARRAHNPKVVGSNPTLATLEFPSPKNKLALILQRFFLSLKKYLDLLTQIVFKYKTKNHFIW